MDSEAVSSGRLLWLTAIAVPAALVLRAFVFEGSYIASGSMEPTLPVGTHAMVDKLTYRLRAPRRGDIIAFQEPVAPHAEMVKRVAAAAGDLVELRRRALFINGVEVRERYVRHTRPGERLTGDDFGPATVPAGHVFVLGDNRDESNDSSVWKDPESGEAKPYVSYARVRGILRGFY